MQPLFTWGLSYYIGDYPAVIVMAFLSTGLATLPLLIPNAAISAEIAAGQDLHASRIGQQPLTLLNQLLTMLPLLVLQAVILVR